MTEDKLIDLTRREMLGAVGVVGAGAALGGAGTAAFFSDTESFEGNEIVAGSLDLKVDWEEHYYDGAGGGDLVTYTDPGEPGYVGLPDPEHPQVWVHEDDLGAYMNATALEAFPDEDDDGLQDVEWSAGDETIQYYACAHGANAPDDLDPSVDGGLRTMNDDTWDQAAEDFKPLVALDDVKPGDFGELTLSFHLCDNPGFVWLQGALNNASEGGITEPESKDDDEGPGVELLDAIQTVWWYDSRGDNVLQVCEGEKLYMTDSVAGEGTPSVLYEVSLTGGNAELTELFVADDGNFDQTDAIAATPSGDRIVFYDKDSGHLGVYDVAGDSFTDAGAVDGDPGGIVLAGYDPSGTLWAASQDTDELYTVDTATPAVTAMGDTGIDLGGADLVFASDGTMYIWTTYSPEGLYKVDDPSSDPTAVPLDPDNVGDIPVTITGLAIRDGGTGDLVASDRENDEIVVIDRTDGTIADTYPMTLGGDAYDYDYGDMTAGKYCGEVFRRGTLAEDLAALESGNGIPLDGNLASTFDELGDDPTSDARECFVASVNHYVGFAWYLPVDHANEIQTDSVAFDLGFYTEQCRHNDGAGLGETTTTPT